VRVPAVLHGHVSRSEPTDDVVGATEGEPLRNRDAFLVGDGHGLAVVAAFDALDVIPAGGRPRPAPDAVALLLAGAHVPGDDHVISTDRGAVVPDRLVPDLELEAHRVLAEQGRLFREDIEVVLVGPVRHALPKVRQNAPRGLQGVNRATLRGPAEVSGRRVVEGPDHLAALLPLTAVAGIRVLQAVLEPAVLGGGAVPTARPTAAEHQRHCGTGGGEAGQLRSNPHLVSSSCAAAGASHDTPRSAWRQANRLSLVLGRGTKDS